MQVSDTLSLLITITITGRRQLLVTISLFLLTSESAPDRDENSLQTVPHSTPVKTLPPRTSLRAFFTRHHTDRTHDTEIPAIRKTRQPLHTSTRVFRNDVALQLFSLLGNSFIQGVIGDLKPPRRVFCGVPVRYKYEGGRWPESKWYANSFHDICGSLSAASHVSSAHTTIAPNDSHSALNYPEICEEIAHRLIPRCSAGIESKLESDRGRRRLSPGPELRLPKNRSTGNLLSHVQTTEGRGRIRFSFDAGSVAADFDTMSRLVLGFEGVMGGI